DVGGKKGGGLFGGKPSRDPEGPSMAYVSDEMTNLSTRLKVLEERTSNMKKKQELIEQNMLSHRKKDSDEMEMLRDEIDEMRKIITEIENRVIMLIKELRLSAKKEDVDILKKYFEFWEPVKFVTQNQVESIVREMIEEERQK
ncbi:hypothetical protein JW707_00105, partial [Candidatus Woesearchaeota archaeon]|nr:hypothetical protein [Candidatus Woesearchaeota archaeon]